MIFRWIYGLVKKIRQILAVLPSILFVQLGPSPSPNPKLKPGFGPKLTLKLPSTPPPPTTHHPQKLFSQKGLF
jgi:hypothetical protein